MVQPCENSVSCDHCYGRDLQIFEKFGKIRTSNFEYPNSGEPSLTPEGHSCKFLASWNLNCGPDAQSNTVTDTEDQVVIIY